MQPTHSKFPAMFHDMRGECVNVIRSVSCCHEPNCKCFFFFLNHVIGILSVSDTVREAGRYLLFLIHPDNPSTLFSPSRMNPLWPVSFSFGLFPRRLFLFRPLCFKQTERFTKSSPRFFRLVSQNSLRQDLTLWPLAANEGSQPSTVSDVSASPLPVSSSDKPAWFVPAGTAIDHLLIWHWD